MKCVVLLDVEGARCPNKALRGMCYCSEHHPKVNLRTEYVPSPAEKRKGRGAQAYRKDAIDLLGSEKNPTTVHALMMVFAAMEMETTNAGELATRLKIPREEARTIAQRFRENNVWVGDKLRVDEGVDMADEDQVNTMFIIYAMCGTGEVVRW